MSPERNMKNSMLPPLMDSRHQTPIRSSMQTIQHNEAVFGMENTENVRKSMEIVPRRHTIFKN